MDMHERGKSPNVKETAVDLLNSVGGGSGEAADGVEESTNKEEVDEDVEANTT